MKNTTKSIRTFFAVPLHEDMQVAVQRVVKMLQQRKFGDQIKWSPSENLHLTLRFLGETPAEKIEPLITRVAEALREIKNFALPLDDLRLFPSAIRPHAIVISCPLTAALVKLVSVLEGAVRIFEFPAEKRRYSPHITLGRLRGDYAPDVSAVMQELPKELLVQEVIFYRSELGESGSKYTVLKKFPLAKL